MFRFVTENNTITGIELYPRPGTKLASLMSNLNKNIIQTMYDGDFNSIEGYWYYLSLPKTFPKREQLRAAYGFEARSLGRRLRDECRCQNIDLRFDPKFEEKILTAIDYKFRENKDIFRDTYITLIKEINKQALHVDHYSVSGLIIRKRPDTDHWLMSGIEKIGKTIFDEIYEEMKGI